MGAHDMEIRELLVAQLRREWPGALLVQEWAIHGAVADVATVNARSVDAYEIKSAADSVTRLRHQVPAYDAVFSRCTLVTTLNHLESSLRALPSWWGIWLVLNGSLHVERQSADNPGARLGGLLWSAELQKLTRAFGLYRTAAERRHAQDMALGYHVGCDGQCRSARVPTKRAMAEVLPDTLDVRAAVCEALHARPRWRTEAGRSQRAEDWRQELKRLHRR